MGCHRCPTTLKQMSINTVTIVGRVGQDPDFKSFESGSSKASFSLAVDNYSKKDKDLPPFWFNVEVWGNLAEAVANNVAKGNRVVVSGRLTEQTWEKDGQKRSKTVIVANDVDFYQPVRFGPLVFGLDSTGAPGAPTNEVDDDVPF